MNLQSWDPVVVQTCTVCSQVFVVYGKYLIGDVLRAGQEAFRGVGKDAVEIMVL
jgi:hypothetical protein